MIDRLFGWGKEHGRLAHIQIQVAVQIALWSLVFSFIRGPGGGLTARLYSQDFPILVLVSALLLVVGLRGRRLPSLPDFLTKRSVAAMAILVLVVTGAGTWLVFRDFALTRDEILANFDAGFLATGKLIGTPPLEWRPYLGALQPQFMLDAPSQVGWLSGYLPGNAALRAIGLRTVGMEWVNPVLAALSVLGIFAIGRRLWPQDSAAAVAALLAATSAQVLALAMTPYAQTAHLAFNLVFLWGFLRGDRRGDTCAIAAGFVATGLHQIIFHPLFAAPFILHLWLRGERGRALVYVLAYAAIGLFWISYWQLVLAGAGAGQEAASASGGALLVSRLMGFLAKIDSDAPLTMGFNVLRFIAWQNPLLIPLAVAAWPAIRNDEGIARPLFAGIVLTFLAMLLLLPWQGLGWGYRYWHGVVGSFCLLAGYGWRSVRDENGRRFVLAVATAVSLVLIVPIQLWFAHDYAAPRARAFSTVAQTDADIVLIAPAEDVFDDFVRNAADLSNRPVIMDLRRLNPGQVKLLCQSHRVAVFDIRSGVRTGFPATASDAELKRYSVDPARIGCGTPGTR